jgi:hypothetical protein
LNAADYDTIVVFANRRDFCLTKICVASIRYFYPEVKILLVKDLLNGNFNTSRLQQAFNIKVLHTRKKFYGWGAAKVHFLLNQEVPQERYLCLDSDTIFVGKVLEIINKTSSPFVVNAVKFDPPIQAPEIELYVCPESVKEHYPDYEYPGYFFNTGQIVVTPGIIDKGLLFPSFDVDNYPFYKNRDVFRLVDQAVLNAILPVLSKRKNIKIGTCHFMEWSVTFFSDNYNCKFEDLIHKSFPFIIHYAGDIRTFKLEEMRGAQILITYRQQYYANLSKAEIWKDKLQDKLYSVNWVTQVLYRKNWLLMKFLNTKGY